MDVSQNLFQVDWTQGNLNSIPWLVSILSTFACFVISIIGFGIVIFSICKNALAGLYAVSPKLWDRVDEIKKAGASSARKEGGNQLINVLGSIPTILCKILPNIKAMTEFEDEQMSPKVYFMHSLPLLCIEIFVGGFIFFGYPATFANKVQEFGNGVIDVVFANVDPLGWVEKLPGEIAIFPFATKDSKVDFDENIYKIASDGAASLYTRQTDIKKNSKIEGALNFENWCISQFSSIGEYMDDKEKWTLAVSTSYSTSLSQSQARIDKATGSTTDKNSTEVYQFGASCLVGDLNIGKEVGAEDNICVILTFTENTVDVTGEGKTNIKDATLHVDPSAVEIKDGSAVLNISTSNITIKGGKTSGGGMIGSKNVSIKIESGVITLVDSGAVSGSKWSPGSAITLQYHDGTTTVKISSITFDGKGGSYFTSGENKWSIGEKIPETKKQSDEGEDSTGGQENNTGNSNVGI